jgi:hypothetical protein
MISFLLGLIPGAFNTINGITTAISNERIRKIDATTDQERIAADERIKSLQAKRDVLIAESGSSKVNAFLRAALAAPVVVVLSKLYIWDKVVGSASGCAGPMGSALECATFRTDPLDTNQWAIITAVVGFYFLYEGAVNVTRIIKA